VTISELLSNEIQKFIDSHYEFKCKQKYKGVFGKLRAILDKDDVEKKEAQTFGESWISEPKIIVYGSDPDAVSDEYQKQEVAAVFEKMLENSFSAKLMKIINSKGIASVDVYKKANIDRRLFSKIRNEKRYVPSKRTAIAIAIALELPLGETQMLLASAGFTLSRSLLFDVIIEYFITTGNYNIYEINDALYSYKLPILGE
jgi:hypothetical protein